MAKPQRPTKEAKDDVAPPEEAVPPVVSTELPRRETGPAGSVPARDDPRDADHDPVTPPEAPPEEPVSDVAVDVADAEAEATPNSPAPAPLPREIRVERKGGFLPMLAGGVLAAAAGYGVATYFPLLPQQNAAPEALAALQSRLAEVEARPDPAADLREQLATLQATVAEIPPPAPVPDLSDITASIADLDGRLDDIEARFSVLESLPADASGAPSAAMLATVEALRRDLEALKGANAAASEDIRAMAAEAEARRAEAEAEAERARAESAAALQAATRKSALGRLQAAIESGGSFRDALADLEGLEIPAVLADMADEGVPTLADLSGQFPPAARVALEASVRATMGNSLGDRFTAFLKTTTGARSLTPREGDDPDAVLSRAEAAVKAGDLPAALAEIAALPDVGQAAMADWVGLVQQRLAAQEATAALAARVEG